MTELEQTKEALADLLKYAWRNTCTHEETHRGGFLWEICDICGAQWADDQGGKPVFVTPSEIAKAEALIALPPPEYEEVEVVRWECKTCGTMHKDIREGCHCMSADYTHSSDDYVKLTGTYKRPKKRMVEKTVRLTGRVSATGYVLDGTNSPVLYTHPGCYGKSGTLTFTWEEQED